MTLFYWRTRHDSNVWPLPSEDYSSTAVRVPFAVCTCIRSRRETAESAQLVRGHNMRGMEWFGKLD